MDKPERKPNRLRNYDYSRSGAYFVTVCTRDRKCILSDIVGDGFPVPQLKQSGKILDKYIGFVNEHFSNVTVDKYIIMPNHFHLILILDNGTGDPSPTVGNVVAWIKYMATKEINQKENKIGMRVFQRSFHDHIIRNEEDYLNIWEYIEFNACKWEDDCFYMRNT